MKVTNKSLIAQAKRTARTPSDLINKLPAGVVEDSYIQVSRNKGGVDFKVFLKNCKGRKSKSNIIISKTVQQSFKPMEIFVFKYPRMVFRST